MFGWLHLTRRPRFLRVAVVASIGMALTASACADRRRGGDQMVRVAVAAPADSPPPKPTAPSNCGQAGAPECPLQAWMDNRLNAALSTGDYAEVAKAFRELGADAPDNFSSWVTWSEQGASAAERQDDAGIRKVCSGCHSQHRELYRRTMRTRLLRSTASSTTSAEAKVPGEEKSPDPSPSGP
jgi:hypothetical protein